jgi:hypothetical protein
MALGPQVQSNQENTTEAFYCDYPPKLLRLFVAVDHSTACQGFSGEGPNYSQEKKEAPTYQPTMRLLIVPPVSQ